MLQIAQWRYSSPTRVRDCREHAGAPWISTQNRCVASNRAAASRELASVHSWVQFRVTLGLYWGHMGLMEHKMETTF